MNRHIVSSKKKWQSKEKRNMKREEAKKQKYRGEWHRHIVKKSEGAKMKKKEE